jgi:uncharacterized protein
MRADKSTLGLKALISKMRAALCRSFLHHPVTRAAQRKAMARSVEAQGLCYNRSEVAGAMTIQPLRDYSAYVPYARALTVHRRTDPQLAARRERAWAVAREIASFLRDHYQPARIRVFGSLLCPELFHAQSDIDLAVEGIAWPTYLRAWNEVERHFSEFKVDLIDLGMVSDRLRQRIEEQGVDL